MSDSTGDPIDGGEAVTAILRALRERGASRGILVIPDTTPGLYRLRRPDGDTMVIHALHGAWSWQTYTCGVLPARASGVHPGLDDIADDLARWWRGQPHGPVCGAPSVTWTGPEQPPDDFAPLHCQLRVDDGHLTASPGGGPAHAAESGNGVHARVWSEPGFMGPGLPASSLLRMSPPPGSKVLTVDEHGEPISIRARTVCEPPERPADGGDGPPRM